MENKANTVAASPADLIVPLNHVEACWLMQLETEVLLETCLPEWSKSEWSSTRENWRQVVSNLLFRTALSVIDIFKAQEPESATGLTARLSDNGPWVILVLESPSREVHVHLHKLVMAELQRTRREWNDEEYEDFTFLSQLREAYEGARLSPRGVKNNPDLLGALMTRTWAEDIRRALMETDTDVLPITPTSNSL